MLKTILNVFLHCGFSASLCWHHSPLIFFIVLVYLDRIGEVVLLINDYLVIILSGIVHWLFALASDHWLAWIQLAHDIPHYLVGVEDFRLDLVGWGVILVVWGAASVILLHGYGLGVVNRHIMKNVDQWISVVVSLLWFHIEVDILFAWASWDWYWIHQGLLLLILTQSQLRDVAPVLFGKLSCHVWLLRLILIGSNSSRKWVFALFVAKASGFDLNNVGWLCSR